jgi:hypothetical protein
MIAYYLLMALVKVGSAMNEAPSPPSRMGHTDTVRAVGSTKISNQSIISYNVKIIIDRFDCFMEQKNVLGRVYTEI